MAPSPIPTTRTMKEKPSVTPRTCGWTRRSPKFRPVDISMTLFGPGVNRVAMAKTMNAPTSPYDMARRSGDGVAAGGAEEPDGFADPEGQRVGDDGVADRYLGEMRQRRD